MFYVKRGIYLLTALFLAGVVVWLGFKASDDTSYFVWFALASAFLPTIAIGAIKSAFTTDRSSDVIERLSQVPEVEQLVAEAENEEERIRLLREQRQNLDEIVRLEARRQTLSARRASLEQDGIRIVNELHVVEDEMRELQLDIEGSTVRDEIDRLERRLKARQNGDLTFKIGSNYFRLSRAVVAGFPFSTLALLPQFIGEILGTTVADAGKVIARAMEDLSKATVKMIDKIKNLRR